MVDWPCFVLADAAKDEKKSKKEKRKYLDMAFLVVTGHGQGVMC